MPLSRTQVTVIEFNTDHAIKDLEKFSTKLLEAGELDAWASAYAAIGVLIPLRTWAAKKLENKTLK